MDILMASYGHSMVYGHPNGILWTSCKCVMGRVSMVSQILPRRATGSHVCVPVRPVSRRCPTGVWPVSCGCSGSEK